MEGRMDVMCCEGCDGISPQGSSSSGLAPPMPLEELEGEVVPLPRDRCNTWPLRRPQFDPGTAQTSPLIHEQIPEESDGYESQEQLNISEELSVSSNCHAVSSFHSLQQQSNGIAFSPGVSPVSSSGGLNSSLEPSESPSEKKSTTRRNAWGNMSYADLITQAIIQSPEKRLTLSQVYEWMVQNVPYFRDKGDSNSSAGWKNSIRHNLSLHSRFMRIQNEGAGKSSWWVINPDAKPGRNPRRQRASTIDATSKAAIEKKRRGARKKVLELRGSTATLSGGSSALGSTASLAPHELYPCSVSTATPVEEESLSAGGAFDPLFRSRAQSSSVPAASARNVVSPGIDHFEDFDFPPWVDAATNGVAIPSDILERTDQMRLESSIEASGFRRGGGQSMHRQQQDIKPDIKNIKQEPGVQPPPSYQELSSVRGPSAAQLGNPLLRGCHLELGKPGSLSQSPGLGSQTGSTGSAGQTILVSQASLVSQGGPLPPYLASYAGWASGVPSCGVSSMASMAAMASAPPSGLHAALPIDLENLTLPDQPLIDMDMESILRHELSQTTNNQLNFDI